MKKASKKASKRSTTANLNRLPGVSAPGHDQAFSEITDLLLELIMDSLDVNGQGGGWPGDRGNDPGIGRHQSIFSEIGQAKKKEIFKVANLRKIMAITAQ